MRVLTWIAVLIMFWIVAPTEISEENPIRVVFPPLMKTFDSNGNIEYSPEVKLHRFIREVETCRVPSIPELRHHHLLECLFFPNRTICNQTCSFGHTFPGGGFRQIRCFHKDNKWLKNYDVEFKDCDPYVDCTLTALDDGAAFKCESNTFKVTPTCNISCGNIRIPISRLQPKYIPTTTTEAPKVFLPVVQPRIYNCDIKGHFTPDLPYCVKAGSGLRLVNPPKRRKTFVRL